VCVFLSARGRENIARSKQSGWGGIHELFLSDKCASSICTLLPCVYHSLWSQDDSLQDFSKGK
jgi:hypothetical protein